MQKSLANLVPRSQLFPLVKFVQGKGMNITWVHGLGLHFDDLLAYRGVKRVSAGC